MNNAASRTDWKPEVPLNVLLARAVQAHPETRLHFHTEEGVASVTTLELLSTATRLANGLRALGLRAGDVTL